MTWRDFCWFATGLSVALVAVLIPRDHSVLGLLLCAALVGALGQLWSVRR